MNEEQDVAEPQTLQDEESGSEEGAAEPVPEAEQLETEKEEPASEVDDGNWYVVHCYSGHEEKVKRNLEMRIESMDMQDQIFRVVVPTEEEVELKGGERHIRERRIFPGYVLVQMDMNDDSWYVVRNTPGVTGFVGSGHRPDPLQPDEIDRILKRMEAEAPTVRVNFRVGETVRIAEGPFKDFMGTVDAIDEERGKVRVMVSFFGRETPVELDFLQVDRV